jgi:hypothetical protein
MFVQFLLTNFNKRADNVCSEADGTDADAFLESLDATLFPGISSSIEAHSGFANEQAK